MNGVALHEQLSRVSPEQAGKLVFLTGGACTPAAKSFLDRVHNVRVEKPFEPTRLRALVRGLVR
jgi:hypothetical protein